MKRKAKKLMNRLFAGCLAFMMAFTAMPDIVKAAEVSSNEATADVLTDLISLSLANVDLSHLRRLNRVESTHFEELVNKASNKVVTVVCR